ncbi:molybdopterin-dependent oxidoreductase [Saliniramus sp.]|uniref:molybdopterin-dependent oxidoreductase n=1 Tax=Saliniramus sp. TaxID=2986772 RepID=UPI002C4839AF|nr:molybdopterin-dependent oxidoreductase [Saliniramus sp.]HMB10471.1 molybdopterin-dependent oxidoreductase [Saliniramus sp.]
MTVSFAGFRDRGGARRRAGLAPLAIVMAVMLSLVVVGTPDVRAESPVLQITGAVADQAPIALTRADLEALPQHVIETHTVVTDGLRRFEGPLMRDLLDHVGAVGDTVVARALNDYEITIPVADFEDYDVVAALTMDGERLSPRDRGPIWIVYPRDDHAELQDIRYDYRWVWQLASLVVK